MKLHVECFCKKYRYFFGIFLVWISRGAGTLKCRLFALFLGYGKGGKVGAFFGKKTLTNLALLWKMTDVQTMLTFTSIIYG